MTLSADGAAAPSRSGQVGQAASIAEDWRAGGFGVYVHWPFCQAKCPYCDFNSHVVASVDHEQWRDALISELGFMRRLSGARSVDTVFFGGGTPSLMRPDVVASVIDAIEGLWGCAPDVEITLEANPTSVEAGRFREYRAAGVTRTSMGVQALDDQALRALGRLHSADEALAAFDVARNTFDRVSFDLICARVGQTPDAWRAELRRAIAVAVDHLSIYQLTIEEGTRFAELYERGRLIPPDEDAAAEMYEATQEECDAAGLQAYEVSNHARPGAESRHNLIYWRYGDYVGVGPGAHGRVTTGGARVATETVRAPGAWISKVQDAGFGVSRRDSIKRSAQAEEMLMMGLRLREGVSLQRFATLAGQPLDAARMREACEAGIVAVDGDRLAATATGRLVLNHAIRTLLA